MSKEQSKRAIVETFAEHCIFTVARHWVMVREYHHDGTTFRDFINDKNGMICSVVELNGEYFATCIE